MNSKVTGEGAADDDVPKKHCNFQVFKFSGFQVFKLSSFSKHFWFPVLSDIQKFLSKPIELRFVLLLLHNEFRNSDQIQTRSEVDAQYVLLPRLQRGLFSSSSTEEISMGFLPLPT